MSEPRPGKGPEKPIHPYMQNLYERLAMGDGTNSQKITTRASALWQDASGVGERVEIAEALVGRRIDGQEISELDPGFVDLMFKGGGFEKLREGVTTIRLQDQAKQAPKPPLR
jgi:hypothetical protein